MYTSRRTQAGRLIGICFLSGVAILVSYFYAPTQRVSGPATVRELTQSASSGELRLPSVRSPSDSVPISAPCNNALTSSHPINIPGWTIRFGQEFWRSSRHTHSISQVSPFKAAPLTAGKLADAIERVSHVFQFRSASQSVELTQPRFTAHLSDGGLQFAAPNKPWLELSPLGLRFSTHSISRGLQPASLPQSSASWVIVGNTAQRLVAPDWNLIEHYQARSDGIEVAWVLAQQPPGTGDMVIEVAISGTDSATPKGRGAVFANKQHTSQLALGGATAVDSSGQAWSLAMEIAPGRAHIQVPDSILMQASYPLAIDPLITPSFELDTPLDSLSLSTQSAPRIAANSNGYFVVWTRGKGDGTDPVIMGARLDSEGHLVDPHGMILSATAGEQSVCAVAADPQGFLAIWAAPRPNSTTDWDIWGTRISNDGSLLSAPFPICALFSSMQTSPALAFNGNNYLVVWRDSRQTGIYGTVVTPEGLVSSTNGFPISTAANEQYTPAVAALGSNYLVVWQDYRKATTAQYHSDIYGSRVTGNGLVLDTNALAICESTNSQFSPAVAGCGDNWLVLWEDYNIAGNDILAARVSNIGSVLDPTPLPVSQSANAQAYPALAGGGPDCLVAWQDYRHTSTNNYEAAIWATFIYPDGSVDRVDGFPISNGPGTQWRPTVAVNDKGSVFAWQDSRQYHQSFLSDIWAATLEVTNSGLSSEFLVSATVNAELSPAVAAVGTNILAVWSDTRGTSGAGRDIYGVRFTANGSLLDTAAIPICTSINQQAEPAVVGNAENFLITWADWRNTPSNANHADIYGTLMNVSGAVLHPNGIPICTATNDQRAPAVALLATNFIIVWQDSRRSITSTVMDIFGARLSQTGNVLDPAGIPVSISPGNQTVPVVAANATHGLVLWIDNRSGGTLTDIFGARVHLDGSVLDTNGFPICIASLVQTNPAVATDGQRFLAVWADGRSGASARFDIYGAFVNMDAAVQPTNGFPIRTGSVQQDGPGVAFNGADYLVTWGESSAGSPDQFKTVGAGITAEGALWPGEHLLLSPGLLSPYGSTVAAVAEGMFVVANETRLYAGARITANLIDLQAFPRFIETRVVTNRFIVELHGAPGQRYGIETSTDLTTWQELGTLTFSTNFQAISEPISVNEDARFYRAILLR